MKVGAFRRKPISAERWDSERLFNNFKGTPWRPVPGRGGDEIRITVAVPDSEPRIKPETAEDKEITRRRAIVTKPDILKFGMTEAARDAEQLTEGQQLRITRKSAETGLRRN